MIKRIITFCLLIVVIFSFLAFYAEDTLLLHNEAYSAEVAGHMGISEARFLSDEYFYEIDLLFERIKKENGKWDVFNNSKKIPAKVVINKMMDDLEKYPNDLLSHKNSKRFFEIFDKNIREVGSITERMHFFRNT